MPVAAPPRPGVSITDPSEVGDGSRAGGQYDLRIRLDERCFEASPRSPPPRPALPVQSADAGCPEMALGESTLEFEVVGSNHQAMMEVGAAVVRE